MSTDLIRIMPFDIAFTEHFTALNYEWLEKYFYIEDYDKIVLENPQKYIIDEGGYIFFGLVNNKIIATVALIKRSENSFELSKMAVTETMQGKGYGKTLLQFCIDFVKENGIVHLFLDSNTKLEKAIKLYENVGFKEIPVPKDTPYERCNIRMKYMF